MRKTPPSAWENGLHEALERLGEHLLVAETKAEFTQTRDCLDARDKAALAYVLWRLRAEPDVAIGEPVRAPGKMTDERKANLTDDEKLFFGFDQ